MKSRLGLLVATLTFALAIVFAGYGYNHKTLGAYVAKESAGPMVSFDAYSRMDKKRDRSAAFAKESPHNKSLLWRQHLAYYEARMQLNDQQKEFLKRVSEFLDESFFAAPIGMSEAKYVNTERGKPFKELMQNVSKLFTPEQSRQLFRTVGDTSTITDWGCPLLNATVNDPSAAKAKGPDPGNNPDVLPPDCDCTGSFCGSGCGGDSDCRITNCTWGGSCGCFGWFDCTASCIPH